MAVETKGGKVQGQGAGKCATIASCAKWILAGESRGTQTLETEWCKNHPAEGAACQPQRQRVHTFALAL